ncbi:NB-ARC domain-containing protein [Dactylosporangium sp. NPDC048998]|uniref:NB-ARC domain-containing protein n=1 Tax=Dactylosporangium sp. NPDC048998 TaxID=3363976 RepID=UPI003723CB2A
MGFAHDLRALRTAAGNPSYRELARTALFAPSVLSNAASGRRLPTLPVTLAFVAACGGDQAAWERRWRAVAADVTAGGEQARPMSRAAAGFARPAQLPVGSMTFVGRAQALADTARVIGRGERANVPLIISGPIGVGKSAFALRLADEVAATFPDGQLYAEVGAGAGTRSTNGIVHGFLRALGTPASVVPDDPMQRLGLYRSLLARRRVFVLLEDVQDEAQVRPLLGRATQSLVVVTSRARLLGLDSMHRIDLGAFTRDESMALLGRLIGADRVEAEYEAADVLADLCGDLPLAVNIVGRIIAARPEWAIAYAAGLLADDERLLDSLTVGDVSVRDRFDAAFRALSPAGRRALCHLGAIGSRWTTAIGLAGETGMSVEAADRALEQLVDAGLLTRATLAGRYCVPVMVSIFAAAVHWQTAQVDLPRAS